MKVEKIIYLLVLIIFFGWGIGIFLDKLATNSLGNRSIVPLIISSIFSLLILGIFYIFSQKLGYDKRGLAWLTLSCFLNSIGLVSYYLLLVKTEVSWATPLTALYPIIPIILGFVLLKESIDLTKIIGIGLSLAAIVFLSL